jgi:aminoglycoside phosphotransferase family enzyme
VNREPTDQQAIDTQSNPTTTVPICRGLRANVKAKVISYSENDSNQKQKATIKAEF